MILVAVLIVLIVVIAAAVSWYSRNRRNTVLVPDIGDGGVVPLTCRAGQSVKVISAHYMSPAGKKVNVTARLQAELTGEPYYMVNGAALGQQSGGMLTFRYKCKRLKSDFVPVPVSTCGTTRDPQYAVDMTGRNAAGTVVSEPYSTLSRVSLERYAESPEVAESLNPITGLGKDSKVRAMSDRYRQGKALHDLSVYELQPGQPGFMEEVGDGAMSLTSRLAHRHPTVKSAQTCLLAGTDVDSDYISDGVYDSAVLKEALTSSRGPHNTLTASKTGLGSIRRDPRYEPGPPTRVPGGDASWSHGGHAGGPTSGGFGSARFMPGNTWDSTYVYGFGDRNVFGREYPVEVMDTERALLETSRD